jgi:hypothetical protein
MVFVAFAPIEDCVIGTAQPYCSNQHRPQYRFEIEGRPADDLQHIADRGLIFERLLQIVGALPQFPKEPRVLHRDHCLRRKILQQRDLLVGERPHLLPVNHEVTEKRVICAQRDREQRAAAPQFDKGAAGRVARSVRLVFCNVCNMDHRLTGQQTAVRILPADWMRSTCQELCKRRRYPAQRRRMDPLPIVGPQHAEGRLAQSQRLVEHRVEHRPEVPWRRVDDLQDLRGRGLLRQSFAGLGDQPRVLHRDHRLRREVLRQRDLVVGKRPHLLAIKVDNAEQGAVLAQRHGEDRAHGESFEHSAAAPIVGDVGCEVGDVNEPFAVDQAIMDRAGPGRYGSPR